MSRLIIILVVAVGGVIAGLLWWSSGAEPDSRKQNDIAVATQAGPATTRLVPSDEPKQLEATTPTATKASNTTTAASTHERIERYGYYEPLLRVEDELTFLRSDPVTRILSPTSEQDAQWMAMRGYPRRQDIEAGDLNAMLAELETAHPVQQAERVEYLTNTIAAKLYRANDPRWRDYANQSSGSFGVMLSLADMRDRWDTGARPDEKELIDNLAFAQVLGEVDAISMFERVGRMHKVNVDQYAQAVRLSVRVVQHANRRAIRRGQKPMDFSPRPPAPWNDAYPDR
jgi:hypothetical protein